MNKDFFAIMRAKQLFVGDICYALDEKIYKHVWGDKLHYQDGVIADGDDVYAIAVGTAHGDGVYYDEHDCEYGVDAGVLGVTNMSFLREDDSTYYGRIVQVDSGVADVSVQYRDGVVYIEIVEHETGDTLYYGEIDTDVCDYEDDYEEEDSTDE